jgi:hypothetical protein
MKKGRPKRAGPERSERLERSERPVDLTNNNSRYVGSGQISCGVSTSISSPVARSLVINGITLSRMYFACFSADPPAWLSSADANASACALNWSASFVYCVSSFFPCGVDPPACFTAAMLWPIRF